MNVLFASDLHGEIRLYKELRDLATSAHVEIIILGGDLLPSLPPTKRYEDMIPCQKEFIVQFLLPFLRTVMENTSVRKILTIPGNWDLGYPFLCEKSPEAMVDLTQKAFRLNNGYEVIGYPFVPPTPFRPKDYEKMDDAESPWPAQKFPSYIRTPDDPDRIVPVDPHVYLRQRGTIRDDLTTLVKPLHFKRAIYVFHSPPLGTRLDLTQSGKPAGSRSIKSFIESSQPLLSLHGHIHEAPEISGSCFDWIGETICVNPGQSAWTGSGISRLSAVSFEAEAPGQTLVHTLWKRRKA